MASGRLPVHAAIAALCFVVHDANHLRRGAPLDVLWLCNVAVPLIAIGCLCSRRLVAIGLTWLGFGTPIWLLSLLTGAHVIPTSPLVHIVAPLVALSAIRRVGWPPRTWRFAMAGSIGLLAFTRILGDATGNVNLVFGIEHGWSHAFRDSYALFLATLLGASTAWAVVFDSAMTRLYRKA